MTRNNRKSLILRAPGKINLFLHVTGKRNDGYHLLETVFQFLDFADILEFEVTEDRCIVREDVHKFSLPQYDLTVRAAVLLREELQTDQPLGVKIKLIKNIPPGSGMGGGSSNAATTLIALNQLWNLRLTREELLPLAAKLGADVPVFIYGKSCWATGIGDSFEHIAPQQCWYCICFPSETVSTAVVFSHPDLRRDHQSITKTEFQQGYTTNDLEPITRMLYPEVDEALTIMERCGDAKMNGSGSSIYLRCESKAEATEILQKLPSHLTATVVRSLNDITKY